MGHELAKYPLEPSYAKALLTSMMTQCHEEMTILVSLLSTEQIYTKVSKTNEDIYSAFQRRQFKDADLRGDHLSLVKIF